MCVRHCGGGSDGSLERVGLLTQQRGMFSFGYKAFLRYLRRGCGQNNASLGYAKLDESVLMRAIGAPASPPVLIGD